MKAEEASEALLRMIRRLKLNLGFNKSTNMPLTPYVEIRFLRWDEPEALCPIYVMTDSTYKAERTHSSLLFLFLHHD